MQFWQYFEGEVSISIKLDAYSLSDFADMFILDLKLQNPSTQDFHIQQIPHIFCSYGDSLQMALQYLQQIKQYSHVHFRIAFKDSWKLFGKELWGYFKEILYLWSKIVDADWSFRIDTHQLLQNIADYCLAELRHCALEFGLKKSMQNEANLGSRREFEEKNCWLLVDGQLAYQLYDLLFIDGECSDDCD